MQRPMEHKGESQKGESAKVGKVEWILKFKSATILTLK